MVLEGPHPGSTTRERQPDGRASEWRQGPRCSCQRLGKHGLGAFRTNRICRACRHIMYAWSFPTRFCRCCVSCSHVSPILLLLEAVEQGYGSSDTLLSLCAEVVRWAVRRRADHILAISQRDRSSRQPHLMEGALASLALSPQSRKVDLQSRCLRDLSVSVTG